MSVGLARGRLHRILPAVRTVPILVVACLLLLGCGDREENEARLFLDRVARVHIDAPPAERRRHIEALEAIALRTESLDGLRDTCVEGHTALVEAEEEQAAARERLESLAGDDPDARIDPAQAQEIAGAIERSSAAIERARGKLTECQEGTRALEREHGH